jgi:hypothetical protein
MSLGRLIVAIERKRRRMYQASGDARLRISQELDLLIVEYMRMVRG